MRTTRTQKVLAGAALLTCLLSAEIAARAMEPRLSSAGTWPDGAISDQYDALTGLSRRVDRVDVAFAGSSMTKRAIDANVFASRTHTTAVNAALPGSSNVMLGPWLIHVVVPLLHPKTVVIGIDGRDFNDRTAHNGSYATLVTSPGYLQHTEDDSFLGHLDRAFSERSALIRVRRSLRTPANVVRALTTGPELEADSKCREKVGGNTGNNERFLDRYPKSWLKTYTATSQTRAIVDAIEGLEARGVSVVLLRLPSIYDYVRARPGEDDVEVYEAALERVVDETGVAVIDGRKTIPLGQFRDRLHLTCEGMATFTRLLVGGWEDSDAGAATVALPSTNILDEQP